MQSLYALKTLHGIRPFPNKSRRNKDRFIPEPDRISHCEKQQCNLGTTTPRRYEACSVTVGREALLYRQLPDGRVRCTACARYCNIPDGKIGLCGIRGNVGGRLYLFVYGKIITGHVDPIEKKPVTHFMPGTKIFSVATTGCNWLCSYCQNYDISQRRKIEGIDVTHKRLSK